LSLSRSLTTAYGNTEGYVGGVLAVDVAWALVWVMLMAGRFLLTVLLWCWCFVVLGFVRLWISVLGSMDEPESLILAQSERWRHA
jgi:hypothetical protein